ncbi:MAG: carboxypeptidase regulatory-like domain-containing protein [Candidatus Hydrogenedentes bacterium]|nr:carboxypeptidase regulatory-like domain-containing protein [Candidatus Hydrogenedentota bacterium]
MFPAVVSTVLFHLTAIAAPVTWTFPVDATGIRDQSGADQIPRAATNGSGTWVAVWASVKSLDGTIGTDQDIFVSRSTDDAATWSAANTRALNSNAAIDIGIDRPPDIACDGSQVFVVVWETNDDLVNLGTGLDLGTDPDIVFSRSTDGGVTWSDIASLHPVFAGTSDNTAGGSIEDTEPRIATDRSGTWLVVYRSTNNLAGGSGEREIHFCRSTDNGATWSAPAKVNSTPELGDDLLPAIATDGAGNWLCAWQSTENLGGLIGNDEDILYATSADNGLSWSPVGIVNTSAATDGFTNDFRPSVASDGRGTWVVTWESALDIPADEGGLTTGIDMDIFSATSTDNGLSFGAPVVVNSTAFVDTQNDSFPHVASDQRGNWMAVWASGFDGGGQFEGNEIFYAISSDKGLTWSSAATIDSNPELGIDIQPIITTDGNDVWRAFWASNEDLSDSDPVSAPGVVTSKTTFVGGIAGTVTVDGSGEPVSTAAIRARSADGQVERIEVTDLNGAYAFTFLPAGSYSMDVFARIGNETPAPGNVATATGHAEVVVPIGSDVTQDFALTFTPLAGGVSGIVRGVPQEGQPPDRLVGALVEAKIADVVVAVTYSSGNGSYALNGLASLKAELTDVTLTFAAEGHVAAERNVQVAPDQNAESNPFLEKALLIPASLVGVVTDLDSGDPSPFARVNITGRLNVVVDANDVGVYAFAALTESNYTIHASAIGYKSTTITRTVPPGEISTANLSLEKERVTTPADINGDSSVNAVDVQLVINAALGINIAPFDADIDRDNTVNAVDVQLVINAALGL